MGIIYNWMVRWALCGVSMCALFCSILCVRCSALLGTNWFRWIQGWCECVCVFFFSILREPNTQQPLSFRNLSTWYKYGVLVANLFSPQSEFDWYAQAKLTSELIDLFSQIRDNKNRTPQTKQFEKDRTPKVIRKKKLCAICKICQVN